MSEATALGRFLHIAGATRAFLQHNFIGSLSYLSAQTNFLGSLHIARQLRSFVLTRPRKVNEDDFTKAAMRAARTHHGLREFTFRDVNPWDHVDYLNETFRTKSIGTYIVVRDEVSLPFVRVREAGVNAMGRRYTRSFNRNLPAGDAGPVYPIG